MKIDKLNQNIENQVKELCKQFELDYENIKAQLQYLSHNKYYYKRFLGRGKSGFVISAYSEDRNLDVAVKSIKMTEEGELLNQCKQTQEKLHGDKDFLQFYQNIFSQDLNTCFLITELCDSNLRELLKHNKLSKKEVYAIALQLLQALAHLHSSEISVVHSNLKPENILFNTKTQQFKIVCSGLSCTQFDENATSENLSNRDKKYQSEEVIKGQKPFSTKVDIYSLGVILTELIIGDSLNNEQGQDLREGRVTEVVGSDNQYHQFVTEILMNMIVKEDTRLDAPALIERLQNLITKEELSKLSIPQHNSTNPINFEEMADSSTQEGDQNSKDDLKEQSPMRNKQLSISSQISQLQLELQDNYCLNVSYDKQIIKIVCDQEQPQIGDVGAGKIIEFLYLFKNAKALILELNNQNIGESQFDNLSKSIKRFTSLEELVLDFSNNQKIGQGDNFKIHEGLQEFSSLKKFSISLKNNNIGEESSIKIIQCIKFYQHIKDINLNLYSNKVTDKCIGQLSEIITECEHLSSLKVNLFNNDITSIGAQQFAESIQKLKNLEQLILGLNGNRVGEKGGVELASSFQHCKKLVYLQLRLSYNQIGKQGVEKFAEALVFNQQLKCFQLFLSNDDLDDECTLKLTKCFNDNSHLENIYINLSCNKITDSGAKSFLQSLKDLSNIKSVNVNLKDNKITCDIKEELKQIMIGHKIQL